MSKSKLNLLFQKTAVCFISSPDNPTTSNYNDVYELVADTTDGPNPYGQGRTNYGATSQILPTEGKSDIIAIIPYIMCLFISFF
jgi:hypothetical protein